jgi:hypothetical protein
VARGAHKAMRRKQPASISCPAPSSSVAILLSGSRFRGVSLAMSMARRTVDPLDAMVADMKRRMPDPPGPRLMLPREQLIDAGEDEDAVMELTDPEMWELHNTVFGGIRYRTMREMHELEPTKTTTEWFKQQHMNRNVGDAVLRAMKCERRRAAAARDAKKQKTEPK